MSKQHKKYKRHHYSTSSDSDSGSTGSTLTSSSTESSSDERRQKKRKRLKDTHKRDTKSLKTHREVKKKHKMSHKRRKEKINVEENKKKSIKQMKEHKQKQKHDRKSSGKKKKSFESRSTTIPESNTVTTSVPLFGPLPPGHSLGPPPTSTSSISPVATDEPKTIRSLAPMTKEQYEKQQSILRRVVDPVTGRKRLVKGDGEIMEEIVSKEKHKAINKLATEGDGYSFQAGMRKLK